MGIYPHPIIYTYMTRLAAFIIACETRIIFAMAMIIIVLAEIASAMAANANVPATTTSVMAMKATARAIITRIATEADSEEATPLIATRDMNPHYPWGVQPRFRTSTEGESLSQSKGPEPRMGTLSSSEPCRTHGTPTPYREAIASNLSLSEATQHR